MKRLKWWQWALIIIGALVVFRAIFPVPADETAAPAPEPQPQSFAFLETRAIAPDTTAVVFAMNAPRDEVEQGARAICNGKAWCKVMGWTDAGATPTAMPMTDREVEAQAFSYTLNRASGMDEFARSSRTQ